MRAAEIVPPDIFVGLMGDQPREHVAQRVGQG